MENHHKHPLRLLYLFFLMIIGAWGGFLLGYHTVIASGVLKDITQAFHLSVFEQGFFVSSIVLGGIPGALIAGRLANLWGRKKTMLFTALLLCLGGIIFLLDDSYVTYLIGRFICGIGIGLASVISPMYLGEIASPKYRGRFVSAFQLILALGILVAYLVNWFFENAHWQWSFSLSLVPAVFYVLGVIFIPETPAWLMKQGDRDGAINVMRKTRPDHDWQHHLMEMQKTAQVNKQPVFWSAYKKIICLGLALSIFQQITGINTVLYYAPMIFSSAEGETMQGSLAAAIALGVVNFLTSFLALALVDKLGRRWLLISGIAGMFVCQVLLGISFMQKGGSSMIALIAAIAYVCFFALSLGPILWVLLSEIYPLKIREKAIGLAVFANWLANYIVALTFPSLINRLGSSNTFFLYAAISILAFFFVFFFIPETKGKSLEEIELHLTKK